MPPITLQPSEIADLAGQAALPAMGEGMLSDPVFDYLIGVAIVVYESGGALLG